MRESVHVKSIFSGFNHNREWGDFQTPPGLALRACQYLAATGVAPTVVIEPTFGEGNFVIAALKTFPTIKLIYGVETQEKYVRHLERTIRESKLDRAYSAEIQLHHDNIFTHRFSEMVAQTESILVLGNPPWVTNAELGALSSRNLPKKRNLKLLNGIDALTGKSNFDISESIILRLLDLFSSYRGTLAMLCKTAIARNIVQIFREKNYRVASLRALKIDAPAEFGASVDACLFVMELGSANAERVCSVASLENPETVRRVFGWAEDKFVSDVTRYQDKCELDGESPLVWRQGIKHDGASVMELKVENEETRNGLGDVVQVEEENLYSLLKSSDLRTFSANPPTKKIIVTQTRIGQPTAHLKTTAPKLWRYLQKHAEHFEKRKSSIYRSKPRFSIFGIGDYSFMLYKVAISGFYKEPNFTLVGPIDNRPVMLDDTCYFVGFANYRDALLTATLLNSEPVKEFLSAIVFTDSKRPYTKEILMRIDLARAAELLSLEMLSDFWKRVGYQPQTVVTESDLADFKNKLSSPKVTHQLQLAI